MLCAAAVDTAAFPEETTELWDGTALRATELSSSGLNQEDRGCHSRPHGCIGIHSSKHSFLVAPWGTWPTWEPASYQNPLQHRDGRGLQERRHEQAWPGRDRMWLERSIKRE